ncbi:GntR family transcriptional regulator [Pseudonocardia lutea]|uniref:GntR family transcriptional regulator n=1 Tax=Pseudonocardia lutea TaxID=2172015 RepID=A0ABW1IDB7_9PSEU
MPDVLAGENDVLEGLLGLLRQRRVGERLPAERDLAELFGVGRAVVRRALRELDQRELIATRRQVGSFVTAPGSRSAS